MFEKAVCSVMDFLENLTVLFLPLNSSRNILSGATNKQSCFTHIQTLTHQFHPRQGSIQRDSQNKEEETSQIETACQPQKIIPHQKRSKILEINRYLVCIRLSL